MLNTILIARTNGGAREPSNKQSSIGSRGALDRKLLSLNSYWEPFTSIPTCSKKRSSISYFKCSALTLKPLDWSFRTWTPTPRLRLYCAETSFNMDIMQNKSFVKFMISKFDLDCISSASTTLGNTCIDLTFTSNISVQALPYVSYFSYHRPVLNRFMLTL